MKKYLKIALPFLVLLIIVGVFFEYRSGYFSFLLARTLYSIGDFNHTRTLIDRTKARIDDHRALAYGEFLLGNTKYRQDDLSWAIDAYSESLRIYDNEDVARNRAFVLEKLRQKKSEQKSEDSRSQENPQGNPQTNTQTNPQGNPQTASGSKDETGSGKIAEPEKTGSGKSAESKKETGSGKTASGATSSGKTGSGSTATGSTSSGATSSGSTSSGAISGKFMQGKFFNQQGDISSADLQQALENIRKTDSEKQRFLRDPNSKAAENSLLDDLQSFFNSSDNKNSPDESEEKQDW